MVLSNVQEDPPKKMQEPASGLVNRKTRGHAISLWQDMCTIRYVPSDTYCLSVAPGDSDGIFDRADQVATADKLEEASLVVPPNDGGGSIFLVLIQIIDSYFHPIYLSSCIAPVSEKNSEYPYHCTRQREEEVNIAGCIPPPPLFSAPTPPSPVRPCVTEWQKTDGEGKEEEQGKDEVEFHGDREWEI